MKIMVHLDNVSSISDGVYSTGLNDAAFANFPASLSEVGSKSILLVEGGNFATESQQFSFPIGSVRVLNRGDGAETIIISSEAASRAPTPSAADRGSSPKLGFGDREFLRALEVFPAHLQKAGLKLVEYIRKIDPKGDLKLETRRFVNRSDNFVTLQLQPRVQEIQVTIRGIVSNALKPASTMGGYTGFKVAGERDVLDAVTAISMANRRK